MHSNIVYVYDLSFQMEAPSPSKEEEVETSDWSPVMVEHRLRLRPWLESMLDSGQIRGLEWIDDTKSYFKIPWKHRSKKDWDMEHIKVFMVCFCMDSEGELLG